MNIIKYGEEAQILRVCADKLSLAKSVFKQSRYVNRAVNLMGHPVAQMVEALRYRPEGHGFAPRWCDWNFSLT